MKTHDKRRRLVGALVASAASLVAAPAAAQRAPTVVEAGGRALAVVVTDDGVTARTCAKAAGCDPTGGQRLRPPPSFRGKADATKVEALTLAGGKRIAWVTFPGDDGRAFQLLLGPAKTGESPSVIYSGVTGSGAGAERTTTFTVDKDAKDVATVRLAINAKLCDKDVLVSTRTLDPNRLELVGTAGPDPIGSRRAGATKLTATAATAAPSTFRVLRAKSASSGSASLAVDGDDATAWVEEEPGAGKHAFASFSAPSGVSLNGLELSMKPPADVAVPRAPKKLSIVVDSAVFSVELPDAPPEGTRQAITFPSPVKASCVAVVIDEVHPASGKGDKKGDPSAYVSEIRARTELEGKSLEDLAKGLSGGGPRARDNLALLEAEGKRGLAAVIAVYPELDGAGRDLARRIIDAAPCAEKLALYLPLFVDKDREEAERARDRIRRCGKEAGPPLLAKLETATGEARAAYAEEAALIAPDQAVPVLVSALDKASTPAERRPLRRALAKAAARETGVRALGRAASDPSFAKLSLATRIDFLRALGDDAPKIEGTRPAVAAAGADAKAFRDRYLVLGPAAAIARAGDKPAEAILASALSDADAPRLRTRAAELSGGIAGLRPKLLTLVDDPEVRVREAALASLAQNAEIDKAATTKLLVRLVKDP
ncbi:MAG: hypothetical protein HOV80_22385, partial [Polyangiaceae bacterium]|nr:hypothetical protein [Polyangiaceae bacterium]